MKKWICCLFCLALLFSISGCGTFNQQDVDIFRVAFTFDCEEVYGLQIDRVADGNILESTHGCNADGSVLSCKYPTYFDFNRERFQDGQSVVLQVYAVDEQEQAHLCAGSIQLTVDFGTQAGVHISGSFEEGFSALRK